MQGNADSPVPSSGWGETFKPRGAVEDICHEHFKTKLLLYKLMPALEWVIKQHLLFYFVDCCTHEDELPLKGER